MELKQRLQWYWLNLVRIFARLLASTGDALDVKRQSPKARSRGFLARITSSLHQFLNFKELRWIVLFFVQASIWIVLLGALVYYSIHNSGILVDNSTNLDFLTVPFLVLVIVYFFLSMTINLTFIASFQKVKSRVLRLKQLNSGPQNELVSIIIPARNEESSIKRTITELLKQNYQNIEIIVVCHNCEDRTFEEAHVDDRRCRPIDFRTDQVGKGVALNHGVKHASGNYLLILDADNFLAKDFIENTMTLFSEKIAAVQGRYVPSNRNYNLLTRLLALEGDLWSTPFMTFRSVYDKRVGLGGTAYIIKKDVLTKVGLFANHLVDDYELSFRLFRNGYRIEFSPISVCYDEKPSTLDFMIRQRARWFRGFLSLTKTRIAEGKDIIGNILWLNPIAIFFQEVLVGLTCYSYLHNAIFEYFPFRYAYLPFWLWGLLTVSSIAVQAAVLVVQYGRRGLGYAALVPLCSAFTNYWLAVAFKAFFVKSWGNTKTQHGFVTEAQLQEVVAQQENQAKKGVE